MSGRIGRERSRALWGEARTFTDLCTLGERFVRGEIEHFPGWNARDLDVESDEIAERLARLCRAGFLTCASQPARADQRAFVAGFAAPPAAAALARVEGDVVVRLFGLRDETDAPEPVSRHDGRFHAFAGHDARAEELACFGEDLAPAAQEELARAVYVSAFDPQWDRAHELWDRLLGALEGA